MLPCPTCGHDVADEMWFRPPFTDGDTLTCAECGAPLVYREVRYLEPAETEE